MKTFCFNYKIEGICSFLPLFICVESTNQIKAHKTVEEYLLSINNGRKVKVWFQNYPDLIDKINQQRRVLLNWKNPLTKN